MLNFALAAILLLSFSGVAQQAKAETDSQENQSVDSDQSVTQPDAAHHSHGIILSGPGQCPTFPDGTPLNRNGCPRDTDGDGVPDYKDKCPDTPPGAAACRYGCELRDPIVINLVNDEFDFDSAVLKPAMKTRLNALSEQVLADDRLRELTIVGHTDWTGTDAYNQGLSIRRAQAVADYLGTHGLKALTLVVEGKGESEPITDNTTPEGRAKNRRVEVFTHSSHEE